MRGYSFIILLLIALPLVANAQYWFQYGARAGTSAYYNTGAKVTIQTVLNQSPKTGSEAFWVGENLNNGAFLQVGYLVTNESGAYPSSCTVSGCSQKVYLKAGSPEWFYEYFNSGSGIAFLGSIGPNDSAGNNNSTHTYGFYSSGDVWYFFMDNTTLGSANLGSDNSGMNAPVAFAEVANTTNADNFVIPVAFSNLSSMQGGSYLPVPSGYSYIGYGVGSASSTPNPYGVAEVDNRVNYFIAGSGLLQPSNNQQLWKLGFNLDIQSEYGNISGSSQYLAYHNVMLSAPSVLYLSDNSRVAFEQWEGQGVGAYSGTSSVHNITIYSNITEVADWSLQYLLNVTSEFGKVQGSGWHNANSIVEYSLNSSEIYLNDTSRWSFENWSNGNKNISARLLLSAPFSINALWQLQYLINATSPFGAVMGAGWYGNGSTARIDLPNTYHSINGTSRLAFYAWSNGNRNSSIDLQVDHPIRLRAAFRNQSLVGFAGTDAYGSPVQVSSFVLGNATISNSAFLFDDYAYSVPTAYYKGAALQINQTVSVAHPSNLTFQLPIYDVQLKATDIFGIPVNVPVSITFLNGTTYSGYSGRSGSLAFSDVPYGSVSASARYGGETIDTKASMGNIARITIVSVLDLAVFAAIILAGFATYLFASHRIRHHNPRQQKDPNAV